MDEEEKIGEYETMQERGFYTANGYTFEVEPVYFGEEQQYFSDNPLSLMLQKSQKDKPEEEISDKDLVWHIIALFQMNQDEPKADTGLLEKVKLWLAKLFRKDYRHYSGSPVALGLVKWLEKKVKYKGKHIRFYDLERKFHLNKIEIAQLYRYLEELSGF